MPEIKEILEGVSTSCMIQKQYLISLYPDHASGPEERKEERIQKDLSKNSPKKGVVNIC
jgi:hypothetical protein